MAIGAWPIGASSNPPVIGSDSTFCITKLGRRNVQPRPDASISRSVRQCPTAVGEGPFGPSEGAPPEIFTICCTPAATAASTAAASCRSCSGP
jgi:hypothetical protein